MRQYYVIVLIPLETKIKQTALYMRSLSALSKVILVLHCCIGLFVFCGTSCICSHISTNHYLVNSQKWQCQLSKVAAVSCQKWQMSTANTKQLSIAAQRQDLDTVIVPVDKGNVTFGSWQVSSDFSRVTFKSGENCCHIIINYSELSVIKLYRILQYFFGQSLRLYCTI